MTSILDGSACSQLRDPVREIQDALVARGEARRALALALERAERVVALGDIIPRDLDAELRARAAALREAESRVARVSGAPFRS